MPTAYGVDQDDTRYSDRETKVETDHVIRLNYDMF